MEQPFYTPPIIERRKNRFSYIPFVIVFILLLLIIPFFLGGTKLLQIISVPTTTPTPLPTQIAFPSDTPTPVASPTATLIPTPTPKGNTVDARLGLDRASLTILVQNGSGRVGVANKASQILKLVGYKVIGTKNADAYDYLDVTISIKPEKAAYIPLLKQDLQDVYPIIDTRTNLGASAVADVLVIVGK